MVTGLQLFGEAIDAWDVHKHRLDVFRLYRLIDPAIRMALPARVLGDLARFSESLEAEEVNLRNLGFGAETKESVLAGLKKLYTTP